MFGHIKNISFFPADPTPPDMPVFRCIWNVRADTTYHARHDNGFADAGLFFTVGGSGSITVTREKPVRHLLTPATVFLLDSGVPCSYECHSGESWDFYFYHFTHRGLRAIGLDFNMLYGLQYMYTLEHISERIIHELTHKQPGYGLKTAGLFNDFLVECLRCMTEPASQKERNIDLVIEWMKQNLEKAFSLDMMVDMTGMGRTSLFRQFKKHTGVSPGSYFINLKLEAARHMLASTGRKIKHISEQLGFYDEYYFSRLFKRRYGISPSEYRNMKLPYS